MLSFSLFPYWALGLCLVVYGLFLIPFQWSVGYKELDFNQ
ncbi:hypothetical protein MWE_1617 [Helicobacter pylori XZ274]|nr:hypothetical protein MWE_1617 [Helicobacter pylori XZ274]